MERRYEAWKSRRSMTAIQIDVAVNGDNLRENWLRDRLFLDTGTFSLDDARAAVSISCCYEESYEFHCSTSVYVVLHSMSLDIEAVRGVCVILVMLGQVLTWCPVAYRFSEVADK